MRFATGSFGTAISQCEAVGAVAIGRARKVCCDAARVKNPVRVGGAAAAGGVVPLALPVQKAA